MLTNEERNAALCYFTEPDHPASFEILNGDGVVMLSAPHAVLQTRNGRIKQAERYTGMLCRLLNVHARCPCIYKSRHIGDDANHDATSDYRDALCAYAKVQGIRYVLDLHQLAPSRAMALCIGTGLGANLHGKPDAVDVVRDAFEARGLLPVTVDDPFAARMPYTVSATAARAGLVSLQLELNTRLLMETDAQCRFEDVMSALEQIVAALNAR